MIGLLMLAAVAPGTVIYGMGGVSCATAYERENQRASEEWALGFLSGRNVATGGTVGGQTDRAGILGEIKLKCAAHPSDTFVGTAIGVYDRLKLQRR